MRKTLIPLALVVGLAFATGMAAAQQPGYGPGSNPGSDASGEAGAQNGTAMKERYQALADARRAALDGFHENRSRIIQEYRDALNATREEFLAAKAQVIADCEAAAAANESKSQCVREGLAPLIEKARADMTAAREKARAELTEARSASMSFFANEKAKANARYGAPSS